MGDHKSRWYVKPRVSWGPFSCSPISELRLESAALNSSGSARLFIYFCVCFEKKKEITASVTLKYAELKLLTWANKPCPCTYR